MKYKNSFYERIPNSIIFLSILIVILMKVIVYVIIKNSFFGIAFSSGGDEEYYNSYALGYTDIAVNLWPIILRYLNDAGLYSRNVISYIYLFLNILCIPMLACKLTGIKFKGFQKYYLYLFFICTLYPTIYFYTLDIYREVFMITSFLIGCLSVKKCLSSINFLFFIFYFLLSVAIGIFLLGLRPYLGYAFILSLFLYKIKFTKKKVLILGFLYLVALFIVNYMGLLDFLTDYRATFEDKGGGSDLGLDFSNPLLFIPNFVFSILGQLFGLYIINPLAIVILLIETVPFTFMFFYVFKNIKLADNFLRFLIIFFVIYGSIWLIGNDNLGTAVRLRVYNYLAIYICFFYILKRKTLNSKRLQDLIK